MGAAVICEKGLEPPRLFAQILDVGITHDGERRREAHRPLHPLLAPGQSEASREEPRNPAALLLGEGHMEQRARQQPTKKSLSWFAWAIR
jgi:hypothetical protein